MSQVLVFYCTLFSSSSLNASRLPTLVSDIQMTWMNISERQVNLKVETTWNGELIRNLKARTWYQIDPREAKRPLDTNMPSVPRDKQEPSSSSNSRKGGSYEQGQMNRELSPEPSISRPLPSLQPGNRIRSSKHPRSQPSMDGRRSPSSLWRGLHVTLIMWRKILVSTL